MLVTENGNPRSYPWLRHAMYYLGEYRIYELPGSTAETLGYYAPQPVRRDDAGAGRRPSRLPSSVKRPVVWFVDHWSPEAPPPPGLTEIEIPVRPLPLRAHAGRRPVDYEGYTL